MVRRTVSDPDVADSLCPKDYPIGCKRPVLDNGYFGSLNRPWSMDLLADQHLGGSIGWAMGEIPIVVALIATFIQWVKDDSRESKRIDRAADRAEASGSEDEHTRYNAYLAELAKRDAQIKGYE